MRSNDCVSTSVCGWCSLSPYRARRDAVRGTAKISSCVRYASHRQGIGNALVQHAVSEAPGLASACCSVSSLSATRGDRAEDEMRLRALGATPDVASIDGELAG